MGVASSVLMATIDASDSSSVDEAECRLLVGDAFDAEMWRSAPKVDAGRVTKRTLLQHLGWPSEVFDGRSGTREEARAVNDAAETAARGTPHFYELSPDAARDARRASYVHSAFREDFEVLNAGDDATRAISFAAWRPRETNGGETRADASPPLVQPRALYLLFHGGGWVFGDARGLNDERLERMANELRVVVVVPDYRKAPEHPFPAPLDDARRRRRCVRDARARTLWPRRVRAAAHRRRERGREPLRRDAAEAKREGEGERFFGEDGSFHDRKKKKKKKHRRPNNSPRTDRRRTRSGRSRTWCTVSTSPGRRVSHGSGIGVWWRPRGTWRTSRIVTRHGTLAVAGRSPGPVLFGDALALSGGVIAGRRTRSWTTPS